MSSQYIRRHTIVAALSVALAAFGCTKAFTSADGQNDASSGANTGSGGTSSDSGSLLDAGQDGSVASVISKDGLLLWLRSDQGVTIENGFVSQWLDQSGHHFDAIQNQAESRPTLAVSGIGGHGALRFDGVDDFFQLPSGMADFSLGLTMFVVVNEQQPSDYTSLLEFSNGSEDNDIAFGQYQDRLAFEVLNDSMQGDAIQYNVPQIYTVVLSPNGQVALRRNSAVAGDNSNSTPFTMPAVLTRQQNFVGQSLYNGSVTYLGLLGETLVYGRALSDADLVKTEGDLKRRWSCCN